MKRPTVDECWSIVRERAIQAATAILVLRGMTFRTAQSAADAKRILTEEVARMVSEGDVLGASASIMQAHPLYAKIEEIDHKAKQHAKFMEKYGEDAFYDQGHPDSIMYLQLAAGLDPHNPQILWEAIASCLQGEPIRPREALPYAILVAHLNPQRDEVQYVERLIHQENVSEQSNRSGEWATAGGNDLRTGVSETTIKPPLKVLWGSEDVLNPKGEIVVSNGIAVCGEWTRHSMDSLIHAVDVGDGSKIWTYPMKGIVMGWPAISGEYV